MAMTLLTDEIRSRAHWEIAIRPEPFGEGRVERSELQSVVHGATVRLRGWPLPYVGNEKVLRGPTWLGQDIGLTRVPKMEAWRMFTSGQFTQLRVISAEFEDAGVRDRPVIQVWEVLFYLTEVLELASRLAVSKAGTQTTTVDVALRNAAGRVLISDEPGRDLWDDYSASSDEIRYAVTLDRDRLVTSAREEAVAATVSLFWFFGWTAEAGTLAEYQSRLVSQP
jgi:hypothetical protein